MTRKTISVNHLPLLVSIGAKLEELRTSKGFTIQEVAEKVDMSRNGYALMEKGQIYFNFSTLLTILDKLEVSYSEFFNEL